MSHVTANPIKVLIVDDHKVVRIGLKTILQDSPDMCVVGEAGTLAASIQEAARLKPDVILLDVRLPDGAGYNGCREIKKAQPNVRILILTSVLDDKTILEAIANGADGYLLKEIDDGELVDAIRNVMSGGAVLDPSVTRRVLEQVRSGVPPSARSTFAALSAQERRLLALLAEGNTNKEIGSALGLGEKTIRNYLTTIFEKIHVSNRAQAAAFFVENKGA